MAEEKRWTPAQSDAIAERGRTLLLSAAAGSGKTATLTERVITSLTDSEHPTDITRLLVVTFTNAAAGELRDRISAAISQRIKQDPSNARLARQLLLLPDADICTIDGFCRKVLRAHAEDAGLAPDFKIGDENEIALLARSVMEALVNRAYEGEEDFASEAEFAAFADDLVSAKNEATLIDLLIRLHGKTDGFPRGVLFYDDYANRIESFLGLPQGETPWGREILHRVAVFASEYRVLLAGAADAIPDDPNLKKKYGKAISADLDFLDRLSAASGYDEVSSLISSFKAESISSARLEFTPPECELYTSLRGRFKNGVPVL